MSALDEMDKLWPRLTRADKARVLQWAARDLGKVDGFADPDNPDDAFPGIESTPGVSGGEPCIIRSRIPVWLLEQARRRGMSDAELLAAYPTLRAQDLINAWAYVTAHLSQIEAQIRDNEAA